MGELVSSFYQGLELLSGFIWGGTWGVDAGGDLRQILPPWASPMLVFLLATGLFFMVRLGGRPLRRLGPAFVELWRGRKGDGQGEITPWQALSTALSGQVGTGNLAGVATAIALGGPGAIFWMWVTALFGMGLAYAESTLAVRFRERREDGRLRGGPMYYIINGLGKKWMWLAVVFCVAAIFATASTGGMIQSNSVSQSVVETGRTLGVDIPIWSVALVISVLLFAVIIGGIKSIGSVAGRIVPFMTVSYVLAALCVLALNLEHIGDAFTLIFLNAWGLDPAAGGFSGAMLALAIRYGVARGLLSNEAGQGSAPIAHAAAQTNDPVKQGEIASIGVFLDTIVICTMTALVILVVDGAFISGDGVVEYAWQSTTLEASAITTAAFAQGIPFGAWIITISLAIFAFTTMIGWAYYFEQVLMFLFGAWIVRPARFLWVVLVCIGALQPVRAIWAFSDLANAFMAIPNLIAILGLSGVVFALTRDADARRRAGAASAA